MYQSSKFINLNTSPDLTQTLYSVVEKAGKELNCMRVGIIQNFYADDLTADVLIANKKTINLNSDGTQNVRNYALIRAKVCYCTPYITYPLKAGDECILLFSDREIESWFVNGNVNAEIYPRLHDLTDAVAIVGLRSLPNMIQILSNTLHLFYGGSDIQIQDSSITENTTTYNLNATTATNITSPVISITGNTAQTGNIEATNLSAKAAASGLFRSADNKTVTVVNGIITKITEIS